MLNKTLLGSAAVIMAVVGAQAADLPSKKAAPATYVKICDAYGAGFYTLPGTDTCVKLGGYFRGEYQYTPGKDIWAINGNTVASKVGVAPTTATEIAAVNTLSAANLLLIQTQAAAAGSTFTAADASKLVLAAIAQLPTAAQQTTALTAVNNTAANGGLGGLTGWTALTASNVTTEIAKQGVTTGSTGAYYMGGNVNATLVPASTSLRSYVTDATKPNTLAAVGIAQMARAQSDAGYETRGRIDLDARTPTDMGAVRTFIRLRAANTSGVRNGVFTNNGISGQADSSNTGISIESALVQWAGFTVGIATEHFTQMPSLMYIGC